MIAKLGFGLAVTVVCLSIVFLILVGLMFVINLQRSIVEKIEGVNSKPQKVEPKAQPANAAVDGDVEEDENEDEELIAVISAAVAAVLGRPASSIVVRSITKLEPAAPSWAIAGRQEQTSTRF